MSVDKKILEAQQLLKAIGLPLGEDELRTARRQKRLAMAFLAVANIKPETDWKDACIHGDSSGHALSTREVIAFWNEHYEENISSGSYDDVRRKDLIWLVESNLVLRSAINPDASTNDPTRKYAVSVEASDLVKDFGTNDWPSLVENFKGKHGEIKERLAKKRAIAKMPVQLPNGEEIELSPGEHNVIQKAIVEKFLPIYGYDSEILYIGDTTKKILHIEKEKLEELGFFELAHDSLPDVVAYSKTKNWIYLIEAVHSSNPMSRLRHASLERLTAQCIAPRIYVSAFLNRAAFREWVAEISWETEVWIADAPEHLIHFNGNKFLGPHNPD
ncbi:MAG: hypothetical protein JKY43_10700 [Phycisphaerales bacterium]|nr:hypothetical protein [Phycisphaerales bacterium]